MSPACQSSAPLYVEERFDGSNTTRLLWRRSGMEICRQRVQDFLQELAVLTHFRAGPPVCAPAFLSPSGSTPNSFDVYRFVFGKVLIHLVEHGMMATTGKNVNNIRFLSNVAGGLLVDYLVYCIGVLESMAWQGHIHASVFPYLWSEADGTRGQAKRLGSLLKATGRRAGVPDIGTTIWRQVSSAIINAHYDQADRACLAAAQDLNEPAGNIDEDDAELTAATLVSMSNHSLRTRRAAYANVSPFANACDGKLLKSSRTSEVWADFFGRGKDDGSTATTQEPCTK